MDEEERLKSSFSSFHFVKTAAGGKPATSCNHVYRRRHCSDGVSSLSLKEKEFKGYRLLARVRRTVPL